MIDILDIGIDNAVAIRIDGKSSQEDMQTVLALSKEKATTHGEIVILELIDSFKGIEFSAILDELKYLYNEGMPTLHKVAIVTDTDWIEKIAEIENVLFRRIDIRCFDRDEMDEAIAFLKAEAVTE